MRVKTIALATLVSAVAPSLLSGVVAQEPAYVSASERLAQPADKHEWLDPLIGDWAVEMRVYPAPGMEPIVSTELSATREWRLGGRYLEERLEGAFAGSDAERVMILGYNNLERRFELATFDTFEPGQMIYHSRDHGTSDLFSLYGESTEAGNGAEPTGRKRDLRFEFEIEDGQSIERIFVTYPGQDEFLFVEQVFTLLKLDD